MNKSNNITRGSVQGVFFLSIGMFISTFINAISIIIIGRLLGPEDYGLYIISMIVPTVLIAFCDLGISPSITKYSAQLISTGETDKLSNLIKTGILIKILFSLFVSTIVFFSSNWIASSIFHRPEISFMIKLTSLYLLGEAVNGTLKSTFIGLDNADKSSIMMNIAALTRAIMSISLIIAGFGVSGAIIGSSIGVFLSAIIGLVILFKFSNPIFPQVSLTNSPQTFENIRLMIPYGIPIYISVLIGVFQRQIQRVYLSLFESNINIGNYATALNFTIFLSIISMPISSSLFPAFSKLNVATDKKRIEKMFKLSVKYSALLMIPVSFAISSLSNEAVKLLYGSQFLTAHDFLSFYMVLYVGTAFGMFVIRAFLNGQGNTKATLKINVVKFCISIPVSWILIPRMGVYGIITSILISDFISTGFGLLLINRTYHMNIDFSSSIRIIITSVFSYLIVILFLMINPFTSTLFSLIAGGALYFCSFIIMAPLTKTISENDLDLFAKFSNDIPMGRSLIRYVVKIEKEIINKSSFLLARNKKK